jgi:hypothetical protein
MTRGATAAVLAVLTLGAAASAQTSAAGPLRWQPGQVLLYKIEHTTAALEEANDVKTETRSLLHVTRRWQVGPVEPGGAATLQMSLTALMQERTTPGGEVLRYDSTDPGKSPPELKQALEKFLNQTVAVLRVDGRGNVVQVKDSKFGPASSYENELPFIGVLPPTGPTVDQTWQRNYQITLDPPLGTGEKYAAVQRFICTAVKDGVATVHMTTEVKNMPANADGIPLWQMMPHGKIEWDLRAGRLAAAILRIDKSLKDHQGPGSSVRFQSTYAIRYAGDR